jgi:DNA-binding CsgD family transcriptional regulator
MVFEPEIDALVSQCRLAAAGTALAVAAGETPGECERLRRGRAFVHALTGNDRGIAATAPYALLACRDGGGAAEYLGAIEEPAEADYLTAAIVLAWSGESEAAYEHFSVAHERAIAARRFHVAAAVKERLAHHALLFGELERAGAAIDEAVATAASYRLTGWLARSLAAAARIALDRGDLERTAALLERARQEVRQPGAPALFAGTGAQLAIELANDSALRSWVSEDVLEVALGDGSAEETVAAAIAVLVGSSVLPAGAAVATAVRRALLRADSAASEPTLHALAARHARLDDARLAAAALRAVAAPDRRYLRAHELLARAQVLFRSGEEGGWIDHAGDAAREFNAMGMRRWTNEAMLLLVRQEREGHRTERRGRSSSTSLTGREQQVANLIRRGARNREVALALQISEHTVERHVSSILGRLGLRSRWQIVDPGKMTEP